MLLFAALVSRSFFNLYRLLVNVLAPAILLGMVALAIWLHDSGGLLWSTLIFIALAVLATSMAFSAWQLYHYGQGHLPESVGAGGVVQRMCARFITWIGTLKFYQIPWVIVQEPGSYKITGADIRELVGSADSVLLPGDILLRGFDGYVDGEFIRRTGGTNHSSKFFSHAALYVGSLGSDDQAIACRRLKTLGSDGVWRPATAQEQEVTRNDPGYFQPGPQMVIHSMAKGVHVEDILTFLRCDHLAVLRLPGHFSHSDLSPNARPLVPLAGEALGLAQRLDRGETLTRDEVVAAARNSALGQIGAGYDCLFEECTTFQRFSCSEFVYYCLKSVHRVLGLEPIQHAIAGIFKRVTVSPADLYGAATLSSQPGKLQVVWQNVSPKVSTGDMLSAQKPGA